MILIDCTSKTANQSVFSAAAENTKKIIDHTFSGTSESKAQEAVIIYCKRILNNKFTMLRNMPLPEFELPVPLILIGPPGIFVLSVYGVKGVFRAKEDSWLEIKGQTRQYQPARPNLIQISQGFKIAVEQYLQSQGVEDAQLHGLLVFMNPGIHIDTVRPAVRVVMKDGLERFMSNLVTRPPIFNTSELKKLVALFHQTNEAEELPAVRDQFDFQEETKKKPTKSPNPVHTLPAPNIFLTKNLESVSRKINLTNKQWIFIGIMLVVQIILLMAVILIITMTS
jgi:hypothetical protein